MQCYWQELIRILPQWMRQPVDEQGRDTMLELRLRINAPPEIVEKHGSKWLARMTSSDDLSFIINTATKYSPWTSRSVSEGYVTASGGHRIGICGSCVYKQDNSINITNISSLCIRVARAYPDVSGGLYKNTGSILIIGRPGSGKTTLLRDLIFRISENHDGSITVLDERRELFPISEGVSLFQWGKRTDVLSGCHKRSGLDMALRTMNPSVVAMDEITNSEDCQALSHAAWCGVRIIATAHAGSKTDLLSRKIYEPILKQKIFNTLVILRADKTWKEETLL